MTGSGREHRAGAVESRLRAFGARRRDTSGSAAERPSLARRRAFGERLRRERERRGVSLEAVSRETRLSPWLFEALERGDCARWPQGVYSRAYIRGYADRIGLDSGEIVREFCETFPEVAFPDEPLAPAGPVATACPPLRLHLAEDRRTAPVAVARAAAVLIEVLVLLLVAAVAARRGVDFWMALAVAALASRVVLSLIGEPAGRRRSRRLHRAEPATAPEPEAELSLDEAARTAL
ncbi:MAG TPA: helix-turn-helix transcriptional regulator [Vicinamibacterales bacterium]|nr:helix-turn-helix transcriptional regulator [Vicinamibacterales bacterium]